MLFNDVDTLGFAEIAEATGIEDKELRRTLQSLACGKVQIVIHRVELVADVTKHGPCVARCARAWLIGSLAHEMPGKDHGRIGPFGS